MEEEVSVVLNRPDEPSSSLGFSLLDKPGFPPVIYDIEENSPAAECGKIEAGDVIMKINDAEVVRYSIKEVLKCLRLAESPVVLILKRDPSLKEKILEYLSASVDEARCVSSMNGDDVTIASRTQRDKERFFTASPGEKRPLTTEPAPMFEAFVMTGERLLKLTKNSSLAQKHQRKVDSLRSRSHKQVSSQRRNGAIKSTPSSPVDEGVPVDGTDVKSASTSPVSLYPTFDERSRAQHECSPFAVNVSKSDEHIRYTKDASTGSMDDCTSSLHTLLGTSDNERVDDKRVLWTYNASEEAGQRVVDSTSTIGSSLDSSHQSTSPPSPTSVSSSVMSSSSSERKRVQRRSPEASISSPDFEEDAPSDMNAEAGMEVSDPSDSDSTLLASEPKVRRTNKCVGVGTANGKVRYEDKSHRIVIQVKGADKDAKSHNYCSGVDNNYNLTKIRHCNSLKEEDDEEESKNPKQDGYSTLSECDDELLALAEGAVNLAKSISPPHSSEEESGSDAESLHSFHYSPKGVDYPSAQRLAKRLFHLDGFKRSDVSRHLSKNNEFNKAVAEEYLKYFDFTNDTLDEALRKFLKQFNLNGETQERERVLVHFSKRYVECNPGSFNSHDAAHTLTCAIMLLNTDLHDPNVRPKMTCTGFIGNLSGLNEGDNFPREVLKSLYQAIKSSPLQWVVDDEYEENQNNTNDPNHRSEPFKDQNNHVKGNENATNMTSASELKQREDDNSFLDYKKGYVIRKCCYEPNGKKTPMGKRGWKLLFCTLRELTLHLHKDDKERKSTSVASSNTIRLHHAIASPATDYTKKQFVFRLQTVDRAEYLFQTSDSKELQSWIDAINLVCAIFSAPALPEPVGSQKKFQRPLLPSAPTKFSVKEQLAEHEKALDRLEKELENHRKSAPDKSSKNLVIQNYKEKESYLVFEINRYRKYTQILRAKYPVAESPADRSPETGTVDDVLAVPEEEEECEGPEPATSNRYSYRAAIYAECGDVAYGGGVDFG